MKYTIGIDYGTNSVRALVVGCDDGREVGTAVFDYPSGDHGILLDAKDPHLARQNPADYVAGLAVSVGGALAAAEQKEPGFSRRDVIGIGVDTTGSTPIPVDASGRPLALDPRFGSNLAAHAWLWKDHTGAAEAAAITEAAARHAPEYLAPIGGVYSSEWLWSKVWRCLKVAPDVFEAAASWVELADYVPAVLAGVSDPRKILRGVCPAGHKAMYSPAWGGLPSKEFLARLDPRLAALRDRMYDVAYPADRPAGTLSAEWAQKLGLAEGHPDRDGQLRRALRRGRRRRREGHARQDHRHVDLRLRRRAVEREGGRHPRHLRDRERLDHAGLLRHRGRAVGGR